MESVTVVFSLWGTWGSSYKSVYVQNFIQMLKRNLTVSYKVVAFTDHYNDLICKSFGIESRLIYQEVLRWGLNLPKFFVHSPDAELDGRVLYFDLDMIICGNIDEMALFDIDFCGIKPFKETNTHMGGGFLSFNANQGTSKYIWEEVSRCPDRWAARTEGGKERLVLKTLLKQKTYWQDVFPGRLISFKKHLRYGQDRPDSNARIIAFHGNPRPHTIMDNPVVKEYWK